MAENKTKFTGASVEEYIASRANEQQRSGCQELMALLEKIIRQPPKMWGPATGRSRHVGARATSRQLGRRREAALWVTRSRVN